MPGWTAARTRPSAPASRASASSTSATSTFPCRWRRCSPAAAPTRTRSSRIPTIRRTSTCTSPAPRAFARPRRWPAATTTRRTGRIRPGGGSRSSRCRSRTRPPRRSSASRASSQTRRRGALDGLQNAPQTPLHPSGIPWGPTPITDACHDITAYPEIGLAAGACEGNGILIDISDPANPAPRRRRRPELRLLALGDVQQRRHEGRLHRRVGRRHVGPLPRHRPAQLGRQRDLRHRRRQAPVQELLQAAGRADAAGELRRSQRHDRARPRQGHHGAGVVPGRHVRVRLHGLCEPQGDRLLRPRAGQRGLARLRRLLDELLLQRARSTAPTSPAGSMSFGSTRANSCRRPTSTSRRSRSSTG